MRTLCVFCGSRSGTNSAYTETARELGKQIANRNLTLIYGGAKVGLMGDVALSALRHGGAVVGVIPHSMTSKEIVCEDLTELILVNTMHERKAIMADRADAFVALPGGWGTCDELFEILTWAQLGIHTKPVAVLNTHGFFDAMLAFADRMVADGLLRQKHRELLIVVDTVAELFEKLAAFAPTPGIEKWATPGER